MSFVRRFAGLWTLLAIVSVTAWSAGCSNSAGEPAALKDTKSKSSSVGAQGKPAAQDSDDKHSSGDNAAKSSLKGPEAAASSSEAPDEAGSSTGGGVNVP